MSRIGPKRAPRRTEREMRVERARQAAEARKVAGVPPGLVAALAVSVPECIARWRADAWWTHDRVVRNAHVIGNALPHPGAADVLQFGAERGNAAERQAQLDMAFDMLTQGIAASSFCPGGSDFAGLHFESDPAWLARGDT